MTCEFIKGVSGVKCPLYYHNNTREIAALTREFKERVCNSLDSGYLLRKEESELVNSEPCPVRLSLSHEAGARLKQAIEP